MAQLTSELSCLHYGTSGRMDEAPEVAGPCRFQSEEPQNRVFLALLAPPSAKNRIKCGSDAVFPQEGWYKMAHIAANQKSSIEEDSWLQV
jgi:hypothetical protein